MTAEERAESFWDRYQKLEFGGGCSSTLKAVIAAAIREAEVEMRERAAAKVERLWQPSVGGYPDGSELASAIRELK